MTGIRRAGRLTFASLAVPNYRRYYLGQAISLCGQDRRNAVHRAHPAHRHLTHTG